MINKFGLTKNRRDDKRITENHLSHSFAPRSSGFVHNTAACFCTVTTVRKQKITVLQKKQKSVEAVVKKTKRTEGRDPRRKFAQILQTPTPPGFCFFFLKISVLLTIQSMATAALGSMMCITLFLLMEGRANDSITHHSIQLDVQQWVSAQRLAILLFLFLFFFRHGRRFGACCFLVFL